jgi:hypothetical protein
VIIPRGKPMNIKIQNSSTCRAPIQMDEDVESLICAS